MSDLVNNFKSIVGSELFIIALATIILVVVLTVVIRSIRCKSARKHLHKLEGDYVNIKNVPLPFKINKAKALAKVNEEVEKELADYEASYQEIQDRLSELSSILAELDDMLYSKKIGKISDKLAAADRLTVKCNEMVNVLSDCLDETLEQEREQRAGINELKERFRNDKNLLFKKRSEFYKSAPYLDNLVKDIENMFSVFEEWMYASEFNKASDKQSEIKEAIDDLERYLDVLPDYYNRVKVILPNALDELVQVYGASKAKKIYLTHLDADKQLEIYEDRLVEILSRLDNHNFANIGNDIDELEGNIAKLYDLITKEEEAFDNIQANTQETYQTVKKVNYEMNRVKEIYSRVNERFGFETLQVKIDKLDSKIEILNRSKNDLEQSLTQNNIPSTSLLAQCEELALTADNCETEVNELVHMLEQACSDEERAAKQLLKLQLVVNDIRCKIIKNNLPSISDQYDNDLIKANTLITETRNILDSVPLNVDQLNVKLQDAIDYIYTLCNNVNNLIGMAKMVENAIVFGNRYRSEYPSVEDDLTRAELCFSNGQYTKALKISLNTLEEIHPGIYDKLVKQGSGEDE